MMKNLSVSFAIAAAMAVMSGCVPGEEVSATNPETAGSTSEGNPVEVSANTNEPVSNAVPDAERPEYATDGRYEESTHIAEKVDLSAIIDESTPDGDRDPMPDGRDLPYFELTLTDGSKVSSESLKGHVVLIDFWATWCGPCWEASPVMQEFSEEFKDEKFVVIGASVLENEPGPDPAVEYATERDHTYPMSYESDAVHKGFGFVGVPTFVLIDKEGKARRVYPGWAAPVEEFMREDIKQLLG
ncbi:MAG: TlpA family protein disulfide reductase [Fimbriimonadaceae bacterium]